MFSQSSVSYAAFKLHTSKQVQRLHRIHMQQRVVEVPVFKKASDVDTDDDAYEKKCTTKYALDYLLQGLSRAKSMHCTGCRGFCPVQLCSIRERPGKCPVPCATDDFERLSRWRIHSVDYVSFKRASPAWFSVYHGTTGRGFSRLYRSFHEHKIPCRFFNLTRVAVKFKLSTSDMASLSQSMILRASSRLRRVRICSGV